MRKYISFGTAFKNVIKFNRFAIYRETLLRSKLLLIRQTHVIGGSRETAISIQLQNRKKCNKMGNYGNL